MQLTIVYPDDLVVIDRVCQTILLDPFNPPVNLHALQWYDVDGRIEYDDYTVEPISELPQWALDVVDEFNRLRGVDQELLKQQQQSEMYLANGQARLERIQQRKVNQIKDSTFNLLNRLQTLKNQ